jgi:predicted TIM-barrel fold metal-dependent hydrolase
MSPLGKPQFHQIYEAAARHGLAIGIHVNRWMAMYNLSPVGFQSYFLEHQVTYPFVYLPHVVSFLAEGVFEKYPDLRLSMIEGGFTWAPPILWRLDNLWEEFHEMPLLKRKPSDYVRQHIRFTTQPMDEPASKAELNEALEAIDAGRTLMFSTDYPHYDFDDPPRILQKLPKEIRAAVAYQNAIAWYGLPAERPTGPDDIVATDRRVMVAPA